MGSLESPRLASTLHRHHARPHVVHRHPLSSVNLWLCDDCSAVSDLQDHPKFQSIAGEQPLLFSRELQMSEEKLPKTMSLGDAVSLRIIANETLAYFIGRTYLFLRRVGIDPKRLRFRQHLANEMAHYAEDCWDAEVECSYGWVECVGLADRSAFDLKVSCRVAYTVQPASMCSVETSACRHCDRQQKTQLLARWLIEEGTSIIAGSRQGLTIPERSNCTDQEAECPKTKLRIPASSRKCHPIVLQRPL